jgi:stress-induced morphogen
MEPPTKRLRILQSVEVDETNPEYINAKQQQQQKFKGRLESIFAKYENMHESMSDEIDMRENKVVVDRGHLRRLARQVNRNETVLLDNLGLGTAPEPEHETEQEEVGGDSEDELAPTQTSKSSSGRTEAKRQHDATPRIKGAHPSPSNRSKSKMQPTDFTASAMVQTGPQLIPNTPDPAANLLSLVQFPQTPAGKQAQTSFYATLAQTINQAVQQAVAPLFSSILSNTPIVQLPFGNSLAMPTTPATNNDKIAPATDPKWFFPPLPVEPRKPEVAHSSPIAAPTHSSSIGRGITRGLNEAYLQRDQEPPRAEDLDDSQQPTISVAAIMQSEEREDIKATKATRRTSPRVEVQRKRVRRAAKYQFTEEDDIYIAKRKTIHKRTWAEIKDSKEKWRSWPVRALQQRWYQQLKGRNLHLKDSFVVQVTPHDDQAAADQSAASPSHHLPTPSSLGHDDSHEQVDHTAIDHMQNVISSSAHFDNDERDLLSIASAYSEEEELPSGNEEDQTFFPDTDEIILPSVELTEFVDEDTLQQGLLEDSSMDEITTSTVTKTITSIKFEHNLSSPTSKRKRKQAPIAYQAIPDSETEVDDTDLSDIDASPHETDNFACHICNATFNNMKSLKRHQANPKSMHNKIRPKSASLDLIGDDELQAAAPITPHIKREFSTPPPTSFLFSTPAAQSHSRAEVPSSGESASGLSRKEYLKQVKQSWTKKSGPASKAVNKRSSFHVVPRKRAWAEGADSDDELGI